MLTVELACRQAEVLAGKGGEGLSQSPGPYLVNALQELESASLTDACRRRTKRTFILVRICLNADDEGCGGLLGGGVW